MKNARAWYGVFILTAGLLSPIAAYSSGEGPAWTYEGEHGAANWGELRPEFATCAVGERQSPVDIAGAVESGPSELQLAWPEGGVIVNNGHTIQVNMPEGGVLSRNGETFELLQFHLHAPSEHLVEGKPAAMEIHFVHRSQDTGKLAVLGLFVNPGEANAAFAALARNFAEADSMGREMQGFEPTGLLPERMAHWAYSGSLTTPPCSEEVSWMVLMQPIEAAAEDISAFTAIYPLNARPALPLNMRELSAHE